jgi:hypothetical protein
VSNGNPFVVRAAVREGEYVAFIGRRPGGGKTPRPASNITSTDL